MKDNICCTDTYYFAFYTIILIVFLFALYYTIIRDYITTKVNYHSTEYKEVKIKE